MLRHTTRSLARLSVRTSRCLSSAAPARAPEVEGNASISAREASIPLNVFKAGLEDAGESSHRQTVAQVNSGIKWHKVNELYEWDWFRDPLYGNEPNESSDIDWHQLGTKLQNIRNRKESYDTEWLNHHHELARTFRIARARLWTPRDVALTEEEIGKAEKLRLEWLQMLLDETESRIAALLEPIESGQTIGNDKNAEVRRLKAISRHTADKISAFRWAGRERAIDDLYKEHWIKFTDEQRREEMLRVRYECARRLGWRKGYTSGFPKEAPKVESEYRERRDLMEGLGSKDRFELSVALGKLNEMEEAAAWQAWNSMDKATRREEEKIAWDLRDRSMIFTDDSAHILDEPEPRWYSQPQKVGSMVFLPNVIIRLVRNTTTRHGNYDAFKATFRVPLSMHKHGLRSYLLAIYGLRTTWCRSLIYRAPIVRNRLGQKAIGSPKRTFKKVEVGILEPFLFPEITPRFAKVVMRRDELKQMQGRVYFKMTGARRWRGKVPIKSPSDLNIGNPKMLELPDPATTTRRRKEVEPPKRILATGGIVTKKKSRILRLIHKKTLAREREITVKVEQLKQEQQ